MAEYDNTNRGAGWKMNAVSGKANLASTDFYLSLLGTGVAKPSHRLFLSPPQGGIIGSVLFRNDSGQGSHILSGGICHNPNACPYCGQALPPGGAVADPVPGNVEYWVNVFLNKNTGENTPYLDVTFKPKEDAPAAAPVPPGDDMPF